MRRRLAGNPLSCPVLYALQGCKDFKDNKAAVNGTCTSGNPSGCNDWGRAYYGLDKYKGLSMNQTSADNQGQGEG